MNAVVFDIETSDFAAVGAGFLLCAVLKPLHAEPQVFRYDTMGLRPGHEGALVEAVLEELEKYQLWIGHNIEYFDWPFLKSRAVVLEVPLPRPAFAYDTMWAFRRMGYKTPDNFRGRPRAGLADVVDFFGIKQLKTVVGLPREHWQTVWAEGSERKQAMDGLIEHCLADVELNEAIYWRLIETDLVATIKRLK